MNADVSKVDGGTVKVEVRSDLGKEVVTLEVVENGPARENDDQDYLVKLTLGGQTTQVLYADEVTVGSWSASAGDGEDHEQDHGSAETGFDEPGSGGAVP